MRATKIQAKNPTPSELGPQMFHFPNATGDNHENSYFLHLNRVSGCHLRSVVAIS